MVPREDFEPFYGQFPDPLDPSGRNISREPTRVDAELAAIYQANRSRTADLPLFSRTSKSEHVRRGSPDPAR